MNAVGAYQNIATHGLDVAACAIEEICRDTALVLREGAQPASGVDRISSQPFLHGAVDHALQLAAVNRKLRHIMTAIKTARFLPHFLAMAIEIIKHVGADRDVIELLQQPQAREFTN